MSTVKNYVRCELSITACVLLVPCSVCALLCEKWLLNEWLMWKHSCLLLVLVLVQVQFNIASVRSRNIFWTGLGACVAFALLFLFISYKPHSKSASKKDIDIAASIN